MQDGWGENESFENLPRIALVHSHSALKWGITVCSSSLKNFRQTSQPLSEFFHDHDTGNRMKKTYQTTRAHCNVIIFCQFHKCLTNKNKICPWPRAKKYKSSLTVTERPPKRLNQTFSHQMSHVKSQLKIVKGYLR